MNRARAWSAVLWLPAGALVLLLALPLVALLLRTSLSDFWAGLESPLARQALRTSLSTSLVAVALVVLLGTPLAWLLARTRPGAGRWIELVVQLPVVLPPSVAGLAMLLAFGRRGIFGAVLTSWGWSVSFTPLAVVLAQVFVAAPFYVQLASAGFRAVDPRLVQVARTLGSGPLRTFLRVTLPLAAPSLRAGAALAWARALGEFGATLMFAGNLPGSTQTLPLAIYAALEADVRAAQALSLLLLGLALALLWLVRRWAPAGRAA